MPKPFITLTNISKSFAGVKALQDINMVINEGETRCLAGENGGGKSTLIKIISGFYTPDSGTITIGDRTYSSLTPQQAIKEGIQIIYQDFSIFPNLTVAENIALSAERLDGKKIVNWKKIKERAQQGLDLINVQMDLDAIVGELSVANKQLVAICRALLQDAKLLIMDEPTTALTKKEVESLFHVVHDLQKKGISIVFVSHKLEEVFAIAEELTILRNGRLVIEGHMKDFDREKYIYYMTGRSIEAKPFKAAPTGDTPVLHVENIGIKDLFRDVSFDVYAGEIVGITGLLGSGRSELARALFGLEQLTEGKMAICGKEVKLKSARDGINNGIAYVPEDRLTEGLFMPHSIKNNIIASVLERVQTKLGLLDRKKIVGKTDDWIEELKVVTPSGELPVQSLSGGNQQKIVLAKWLSTDPKLLILNGPTVGIDIGTKSDIYEYTQKLAAQGMAVIIISDDIPEVLQNCNRVLLMKKGLMTEQFEASELTEQSLAELLSSEG